MPGLNPFLWLLCGSIAAASALVTIAAGFGAFGSVAILMRRHKNAYFVAILVGLITSIVACPLTFWILLSWADRDPSIPVTQPADSELIGSWILTPATLDDMKTRGGYEITSHSFTLNGDGTFELVNLPDWWLNYGKSSKSFYSGTGTWKVDKDVQGYWFVRLQFSVLSGSPSAKLAQLYIGQDKSGLYLYDNLGDADSGNAMFLKKP